MNLRISKTETALLVIDMQNGFVHPESGMGKSVSGTKAQRKIVPEIKNLVRFARSLKLPVIWSKQEHFSDDVMRNRRTINAHSAKQGFLPCLRGTWESEFFEDLREVILPQDHVVEKHRASVFYNTNLETKLRMLGTRFLLVAGCNTEFCVESTVRDAYARDLEVLVVQDCVAGINPEFHKNSLTVMQSYFGEVMPLEQIMEILS